MNSTIAVIGAGPIGLAAAHVIERGMKPIVLERGPAVGYAELGHPEPGFYIAGMKSYGRAPTFLLATGHEQVRSIVAEIGGDHEAARRVELVLPETGVCSATPGRATTVAASQCCGGPAPVAAKACCADNASAKAAGKAGCGCGTTARADERAMA